jgi:hypothetical protein
MAAYTGCDYGELLAKLGLAEDQEGISQLRSLLNKYNGDYDEEGKRLIGEMRAYLRAFCDNKWMDPGHSPGSHAQGREVFRALLGVKDDFTFTELFMLLMPFMWVTGFDPLVPV